MATPDNISTPTDDRPTIDAVPQRSGTPDDSDGISPPTERRSHRDKAKAHSDKAVTPGVTADRTIRPGNESSYPPRAHSIEETADEERAPRQRGDRLTVEPPGFVSLTDEQRREAVAALAALLAPLLTGRFVQKGRSAT